MVLILKGIQLEDFCTDVVDTFILGGIGLLFFMVFLVVTFYNLYHISLKKEFFDYFPLIFLLVFGGLFYLSINSPALDIFKTKAQAYQSTANSNLELTLYTDNSFLVKIKKGESTCFTKGTYLIEEDRLYLSDFSQELNSISNQYRLDLSNGFLVGNDTLKIKKER